MSDLFLDLQDAVAELILADSWFSQKPAPRVLTETLGDLESEIERELAGTGLTLIVLTPEMRESDADGFRVCEVDLVVGIGERVRSNRGAPSGTKKTAAEARTRMIAILRGAEIEGGWRPLHFVKATKGEANPDLVDYTLLFQTAIRLQTVEEA